MAGSGEEKDGDYNDRNPRLVVWFAENHIYLQNAQERRRKISRGKYRKEEEQPGKELEDVEEGRSLNSPMWAFLVGGVLGEGFPQRVKRSMGLLIASHIYTHQLVATQNNTCN